MATLLCNQAKALWVTGSCKTAAVGRALACPSCSPAPPGAACPRGPSALEPEERGLPALELPALLAAGWDGVKAREAGFELAEMAAAGCSIRKIRLAGWDDASSAQLLRQVGVDAGPMKLGGWSLSELRTAGYSSADLRLAGFSAASLAALQRVLDRRGGAGRRGTFQFRAGS
mmetsp:Transcript_19468/g.60220  ORF Transcript_19468/g.60220 Transcript_19468/m.60220 type:complete len:173 (+) Transcript_19468:557-1075(+)